MNALLELVELGLRISDRVLAHVGLRKWRCTRLP
jgi:hypothetical protein